MIVPNTTRKVKNIKEQEDIVDTFIEGLKND